MFAPGLPREKTINSTLALGEVEVEPEQLRQMLAGLIGTKKRWPQLLNKTLYVAIRNRTIETRLVASADR